MVEVCIGGWILTVEFKRILVKPCGLPVFANCIIGIGDPHLQEVVINSMIQCRFSLLYQALPFLFKIEVVGGCVHLPESRFLPVLLLLTKDRYLYKNQHSTDDPSYLNYSSHLCI